MKISIHNYLTEQQETITIPDDTHIETELSKLGYSLSNIDYMVLQEDKCGQEQGKGVRYA